MLVNNPKSPSEIKSSPHVISCLYPFFWLAFLTLVSLYAIRPIMDHDFWWHLKSGEVILQQKALLSIDPFNYTGDIIVKGREYLILNGYWLWQIAAAGMFAFFGFNGIISLKIITAALISLTVFYQLKRQNLTGPVSVTLVTFGSMIFVSIYNLERPQVFSILFLTILIGMISQIRAGTPPSWMLLPMMTLWANIHGGFVVGDILLGIAAVGFLIQYHHEKEHLIRLLFWSLAGILASFANPCGWTALIEAFNSLHNPLTASNVEYRSTWAMFFTGSRFEAITLWIISLFHFIALLLVPRRNWPEIFISVFVIAFGLMYLRNTGFIAVSLLPVTCYYLEEAMKNRISGLTPYVRWILFLACSVLIFWMGLQEWQLRKTSSGPIDSTFPVEMANFMKSSGLSGNLFNGHEIGGYLDWALYPQWKTFIDGRELDPQVSKHYLAIALASMEVAEGKPRYELLLDRYRIDVIAMKTTLFRGNLQPLLQVLLASPDWTPVFQDWMSFVLVRNSGHNAEPIRRYAIDKALFIDNMLTTAASILKTNPGNKTFLTLYNDLVLYKARTTGTLR